MKYIPATILLAATLFAAEKLEPPKVKQLDLQEANTLLQMRLIHQSRMNELIRIEGQIAAFENAMKAKYAVSNECFVADDGKTFVVRYGQQERTVPCPDTQPKKEEKKQ